MLSDLRESGSIEQDADIVMFIYRPDKVADPKEVASGAVEKNVAEVIIEKNRSGDRGSAKLLFKGAYSKFVNYTNYQGMPDGGYEPREEEDEEEKQPKGNLDKIESGLPDSVVFSDDSEDGGFYGGEDLKPIDGGSDAGKKDDDNSGDSGDILFD